MPSGTCINARTFDISYLKNELLGVSELNKKANKLEVGVFSPNVKFKCFIGRKTLKINSSFLTIVDVSMLYGQKDG